MRLILILFVLYVGFSLGTIDENSPYWTSNVQFCGSRLSAELAIICKGRYNEDKGTNHPIYQSTPSSKAKRGVHDDCCKTMCTRRYLKTYYCGPEPELYTSSQDQLREMVYVNYTYYYTDLLWIALLSPPPDE